MRSIGKTGKRRGPSHLFRGFAGGVALVAFMGLCFFPVSADLAASPSAAMLRTLATICGAFLVAWAVQCALLIRSSYFRDTLQETLVGSLIGIAGCGFLSVILALGLAERAEAGHWIWPDGLVFAFVVSAFSFLGICIVLLVWFAYEWARQARVDPPE